MSRRCGASTLLVLLGHLSHHKCPFHREKPAGFGILDLEKAKLSQLHEALALNSEQREKRRAGGLT